jgi:hypothetical protein
VEARLRLAAQVLQEPGPEKACEPGESRAVFPFEVECAWQSQAAFRAPHLVERAAEYWPPES